jgi:hypothetical protein
VSLKDPHGSLALRQPKGLISVVENSWAFHEMGHTWPALY